MAKLEELSGESAEDEKDDSTNVSLSAVSDRRPWLLVVAALVAASLVALVAFELGRSPSGAGGDSAGRPTPPGSVAAPGIKQADWKMEVYPAAVFDKVSKKLRARIVAQSGRVRRTIAGVYDAMFLDPATLDRALRQNFSGDGARAFERSGAGLPRGADNVKIERRIAHIGIDATGATRAAARVRIVASGDVEGNPFAIEQIASLYLTSANHQWKIIGFEVDQHPFHKRDSKKDEGESSRGDKKKEKGEGGKGK